MGPMSDPSRREVLRAGAVLAAAAAASAVSRSALAAPLLRPLPLSPLPGATKTRHVVLVVFGGGVRSRETIEAPDNVPNLMRIAGEGVLYPATRVVNNGHYGAAMSIFTGVSESYGIRENERPGRPTLFEHLRRDASLIGGEGVFNAEFKAVVAGEKGLAEPDPRQEALLARMRAAIDTPLPAA